MAYHGKAKNLPAAVVHTIEYCTPTAPGRAPLAYCQRCGAHRYPDLGERFPQICTPTPEWLRVHPEEKGHA